MTAPGPGLPEEMSCTPCIPEMNAIKGGLLREINEIPLILNASTLL